VQVESNVRPLDASFLAFALAWVLKKKTPARGTPTAKKMKNIPRAIQWRCLGRGKKLWRRREWGFSSKELEDANGEVRVWAMKRKRGDVGGGRREEVMNAPFLLKSELLRGRVSTLRDWGAKLDIVELGMMEGKGERAADVKRRLYRTA
jgi:hypothetical protein